MADCTFIYAFNGQSREAPSPGTRGRGMKTSAESLLITISNAQRARQMREGERIKGERVREEEREREREWAFVCGGTDRETKRT